MADGVSFFVTSLPPSGLRPQCLLAEFVPLPPCRIAAEWGAEDE